MKILQQFSGEPATALPWNNHLNGLICVTITLLHHVPGIEVFQHAFHAANTVS